VTTTPGFPLRKKKSIKAHPTSPQEYLKTNPSIDRLLSAHPETAARRFHLIGFRNSHLQGKYFCKAFIPFEMRFLDGDLTNSEAPHY
jgi:hypothetical protein